MALTQTELATTVADRAELSRNHAKRALAALDEIVLDGLGNARKVRIGDLVQLTVRVTPAQKGRNGRNPATGEEITISQAGERRLARPTAGAGEASAAVGAEGASPACCLNKSGPAVAPLHATRERRGGVHSSGPGLVLGRGCQRRGANPLPERGPAAPTAYRGGVNGSDRRGGLTGVMGQIVVLPFGERTPGDRHQP